MSILNKMKRKIIREGRWQDDPPTDKQINAIQKMADRLGWGYKYPQTKLQAAECITEMKQEIANRPKNYGYLNDWEDDDWYYNQAFDLHW